MGVRISGKRDVRAKYITKVWGWKAMKQLNKRGRAMTRAGGGWARRVHEYQDTIYAAILFYLPTKTKQKRVSKERDMQETNLNPPAILEVRAI